MRVRVCFVCVLKFAATDVMNGGGDGGGAGGVNELTKRTSTSMTSNGGAVQTSTSGVEWMQRDAAVETQRNSDTATVACVAAVPVNALRGRAGAGAEGAGGSAMNQLLMGSNGSGAEKNIPEPVAPKWLRRRQLETAARLKEWTRIGRLTGIGFTDTQIACLRAQIFLYRKMRKAFSNNEETTLQMDVVKLSMGFTPSETLPLQNAEAIPLSSSSSGLVRPMATGAPAPATAAPIAAQGPTTSASPVSRVQHPGLQMLPRGPPSRMPPHAHAKAEAWMRQRQQQQQQPPIAASQAMRNATNNTMAAQKTFAHEPPRSDDRMMPTSSSTGTLATPLPLPTPMTSVPRVGVQAPAGVPGTTMQATNRHPVASTASTQTQVAPFQQQRRQPPPPQQQRQQQQQQQQRQQESPIIVPAVVLPPDPKVVAAENLKIMRLTAEKMSFALGEASTSSSRMPLFVPVRNIEVPNQKDKDGNVFGRLEYDVFNLLASERRSCIDRLKRRKEAAMRARLAEIGADRDGGCGEERLSILCRLKVMGPGFADMQSKLRKKLEATQSQIMQQPASKYKRFVKWGNRQLATMKREYALNKSRAALALVKDVQEEQRRMLSRVYAERDRRVHMNKAIIRFHEKLSRGNNRKKIDAKNLRLEAIKSNNAESYLEMLARDGAEGEGYEQIEAFLKETEKYLDQLGAKIAVVKMQKASAEAATAAALDAVDKGYTDAEIEEIKREASAAVDPETVLGTGRLGYYSVAHHTEEVITTQPSCLKGGTLREYQVVGLQWAVSLYNNKLNGLLADEMGLGKTVQVISLLGYLMEMKGVTGPHLIIVPNAVVGNWMYEFGRWLPQLTVMSHIGEKKARHEKFQREVMNLKINVVVTTYEYAMRDRAKLSNVQWKYIVIDEAQRLKSRKSRLSKDLDRFSSQRRLLLTGTPLQNDLGELWSLLNLLLPEVFDSQQSFEARFTDALLAKEENGDEDWLEKEKRIIIIGRLHQILEPFMLRRQVEDVEGKLPPKISHVIKCPMSMYQNFIYDWVRYTGTVRKDPYSMFLAANKATAVRHERYKPLANRVMELKKVSNHPHLTYVDVDAYDGETELRRCGKLWVLDRMLVKLKLSGHRVLLFSTMKKCLDIIERYLLWRRLEDGSQMKYSRIDGSTPLEDRTQSIQEFNSPGSDTFIFLISIRAGGRGINLQTADTVVMYDPDYNPKNEEQAIARAHRIGQTKEVRVFHMESVAEQPFEDVAIDDDDKTVNLDTEVFSDFPESAWIGDSFLNRTRNYSEAVEGLIRTNIQQSKIKMADEIINAGAFDGKTTDDEKRANLEKLLKEKKANIEHGVRSMREINRLMARSSKEVKLFDKLDATYPWIDDPCTLSEVPDWLRFTPREAMCVVDSQNPKDKQQEFGAALVVDFTSERASRRSGSGADSPSKISGRAMGMSSHDPVRATPRISGKRTASDAGLTRLEGEENGVEPRRRTRLHNERSPADEEEEEEEEEFEDDLMMVEEEEEEEDDDGDDDDDNDVDDSEDGGAEAQAAVAPVKIRFIQKPQQKRRSLP